PSDHTPSVVCPLFVSLSSRPLRSTRVLPSFPTRRSSDLELRVDAVGFHSGEAVDPGGLLPGLTVIGADLHPDTWGGPDGGSAVGGDRDDPRFLGALDRRTGGPRRAGIVRGGDPSDAFAIDAGTNEDVLVESGDVDAAGIPQIGVLDHARHLIDVLVDEAAQVVHR